MSEDLYVIVQEPRGWSLHAGDRPRGMFRTRDEAVDAAADAARRSRRLGRYASITVRHRALPVRQGA